MEIENLKETFENKTENNSTLKKYDYSSLNNNKTLKHQYKIFWLDIYSNNHSLENLENSINDIFPDYKIPISYIRDQPTLLIEFDKFINSNPSPRVILITSGKCGNELLGNTANKNQFKIWRDKNIYFKLFVFCASESHYEWAKKIPEFVSLHTDFLYAKDDIIEYLENQKI